MLIVLFFAVMMLDGAVFTIMGPLLGDIKSGLNIDVAHIGLLTGAMFLGDMAGRLSSSYTSGKFTARWNLITTSVLMVIGCLGFSLAQKAQFGIPVIAIAGFSVGLQFTCTSVMVGTIWQGTQQKVLNILYAGFAVGVMISAVIAKYAGSWRTAYIICAGWAAVICICSIIEPRLNIRASVQKLSFHSIRNLITSSPKALSALLVMMMLYVGAEMTVTVWSTLYLKTIFGTGALIVTGIWCALFAGRLLNGVFAGKWPDMVLLAVMSSAACLGIAGASMAPNSLAATIWLLFTALAFAGIYPILISTASARYGEQSGVALAVLTGSGSLGAALFPGIVGMIVASQGIRYGVGCGSIFCIIIFGLALMSSRSK